MDESHLWGQPVCEVGEGRAPWPGPHRAGLVNPRGGAKGAQCLHIHCRGQELPEVGGGYTPHRRSCTPASHGVGSGGQLSWRCLVLAGEGKLAGSGGMLDVDTAEVARARGCRKCLLMSLGEGGSQQVPCL